MTAAYMSMAFMVPILLVLVLAYFCDDKECKKQECSRKKIKTGKFKSYEEARDFFRHKHPNLNLEDSSMHRVSVLMYFGWRVSIDSRKRYLVFTRKFELKEFRIGDRLKCKQFLIPSKNNAHFNNW